jgi:hypothetical protein
MTEDKNLGEMEESQNASISHSVTNDVSAPMLGNQQTVLVCV